MEKSDKNRNKMSSQEKVIVAISLVCLTVSLIYKLISIKPVEEKTITYRVTSNSQAEDVSEESSSDGKSDVAVSDSESPVNINEAGVDELCSLNGIGVIKANAIIAYRESNGEFKNIEEIKNVKGIGDAIYEKIKERITIG